MTTYAQEAADVTLSADEVAIIFSFLPPKDILLSRVCTTWRDAAKQTLVPLSVFEVNSVKSFNAMRVMADELPNIQQIAIGDLGGLNRYIDGEDPHEHITSWVSRYSAHHDINIISNFSKLRILEIFSNRLNGRYPALFNFPLLQKLSIVGSGCNYLHYDFDMITAGFPLLKDLSLDYQEQLTGNFLTGNLSSLSALKNTLESVSIRDVAGMRGNLMDLADFPHLRELDLCYTAVTGDMRHIQEQDFPALESLSLPEAVVGGNRYEFQLVSDVPTFMRSIHHLLKRRPRLFGNMEWSLSSDSPDYYQLAPPPLPPFHVKLFHAGSRLGWSWCSPLDKGNYCMINWLDPEPSGDSHEYQAYVEGMQRIENGHLDPEFFNYKGLSVPPTAEEFELLLEEYSHRFD